MHGGNVIRVKHGLGTSQLLQCRLNFRNGLTDITSFIEQVSLHSCRAVNTMLNMHWRVTCLAAHWQLASAVY